MTKIIQSVEPNIADLVNGWLKSYTTTIDMFGSAKHRNYRYGAVDRIAVVHTESIPIKAAIFVTSAIKNIIAKA